MGGGKTGQFDRIYYNEGTGEVVLVECKGGSAGLGQRNLGKVAEDDNKIQVAQQGTEQYRDDLLSKIPEKSDLSNKIKEALLDENLNYILFKQKLKDDGSLGDLLIKNFE
ncbi:hypothetical protein EI427_25035 [Flammeovirga pectinis]|uniref:Uncharacterized protein n=1 Tax=Flammeovirga pectinis TaxID=2494373 RepID=A0A3S9PB83_9BACT|nr:hypothetical protein [Flammeovirga pectinis]AZQ65478.1 hypothetical protein EI427_25025 [Flammeovirga pectinis]AZQ65480.1 hypothetical protein EI427_25035 [Flammeovirga pectinis]